MRTLILLIFFCNSVLAITESQKVTSVYDPNFDVDSNLARFSRSVDMNDGFSVIGNPFHNYGCCQIDNPFMPPSAYIYKKNERDFWDIYQKLIPSDQEPSGSNFGVSVAISGNNQRSIAVFDRCGNGFYPSTCRSAIYIFEMNMDGFWEETQKITPSENESDWGTGDCNTCVVDLEIYNNTLVLGNKIEENKNEIVGGILIFERDLNGVWNKTQTIYGQADSNFPSDIDIHKDKIIASDSYDSENHSRSGAVFFYEKNGTFWHEAQKIRPNDNYEYQYFGRSISLSDTNIFVGDSGIWKYNVTTADALPATPGSTYVFSLNKVDLSWHQSQKILAPISYPKDSFGINVTIDNNAAVIVSSRPRSQIDPTDYVTGYAHLYLKNENGFWAEREILTVADDTNLDFGRYAIAIFDGDIVIGHDWKREYNLNWWGAAYFYNSNQLLTNIPAMGGIGLLALGLSMLGLGAVRLRKK